MVSFIGISQLLETGPSSKKTHISKVLQTWIHFAAFEIFFCNRFYILNRFIAVKNITPPRSLNCLTGKKCQEYIMARSHKN